MVSLPISDLVVNWVALKSFWVFGSVRLLSSWVAVAAATKAVRTRQRCNGAGGGHGGLRFHPVYPSLN